MNPVTLGIDIYGLKRHELCRQREDVASFCEATGTTSTVCASVSALFAGCGLWVSAAAKDEQRKCQGNDDGFHAFSRFWAKGLSGSSGSSEGDLSEAPF